MSKLEELRKQSKELNEQNIEIKNKLCLKAMFP